MTQSPRRQADIASPQREASTKQPPMLSHGGGSSSGLAEGSTSEKRSGILDTLFSPMFTFFGGKSGETDADNSTSAAAAAATAAAVAAAEAKAAQAQAPPPPPPPPPQQHEEEDGGEPEFDPYAFIRTLPPCPRLTRPVCLPKKTRGTPPISLVLDLDETLLHSSIVPLPTYDIVRTGPRAPRLRYGCHAPAAVR